MKETIWFNTAKANLEEIREFYKSQDYDAEPVIIKSIFAITDLLSHSPMIGAREYTYKSKYYKQEFRSIVTKGGLFRIVYFVEEDYIGIVRVFPCRKNPETF